MWEVITLFPFFILAFHALFCFPYLHLFEPSKWQGLKYLSHRLQPHKAHMNWKVNENQGSQKLS